MQITAPFTQLPNELNLLIAGKLRREDCINLRLLNNDSRSFINNSKLLEKYNKTLKVIPQNSRIGMKLLGAYFAGLVCIGLEAGYKHGFNSGVTKLCGLIAGHFVGSFVMVQVLDNMQKINVNREFFRWAVPISVIVISTTWSYILFTAEPSFSIMQGFAYSVHTLTSYLFTELNHNSTNIDVSLRINLQNAVLSRINLSHVNPKKLHSIHYESDLFALKVSIVVSFALIIFTNPIFTITGCLLVNTAAKVGYMYYLARKATLT